MTQTISRMYEARANADAAVAELRRAAFTDRIRLVASTGAPDDEVVAELRRGGVMAGHAAVFAEGIRRGETLVSVDAPFGEARWAITILEKHGPVDTGLGEQGYDKPPPDPAAPLSSAAGWTVLLDNPAPLSSWLGLPVLASRRTKRKPASELVDDPAPFSKAIGMAVLTDRATMLSSRLGWRTLWGVAAPLSGRLGLPVLSKRQGMPAARFGLPLLSGDAAPFSRRVGWRVLLNDPAPLSRLFGWRVLPKRMRKAATPG